jgi:hypothetical protein
VTEELNPLAPNILLLPLSHLIGNYLHNSNHEEDSQDDHCSQEICVTDSYRIALDCCHHIVGRVVDQRPQEPVQQTLVEVIKTQELGLFLLTGDYLDQQQEEEGSSEPNYPGTQKRTVRTTVVASCAPLRCELRHEGQPTVDEVYRDGTF